MAHAIFVGTVVFGMAAIVAAIVALFRRIKEGTGSIRYAGFELSGTGAPVFLLAGVVLMLSGGSGFSTLERNRVLAAGNDSLNTDLLNAANAAGPARLKAKLSEEDFARISARVPVWYLPQAKPITVQKGLVAKPITVQQAPAGEAELRAMRENVQSASTALERATTLLQECQQRVSAFTSSFAGVITSWQIGMQPGLRQDLGTLHGQLGDIQQTLGRSAVEARDARNLLTRK